MDNRTVPESRLKQQLNFILEIDRLKGIMRRSMLVSGDRYENSAEHSWHVALMAVLLSEHSIEPVDVLHMVKMLLVHDIVEIDAGDTYAYLEARQSRQFSAAMLAEILDGLDVAFVQSGLEEAAVDLPEPASLLTALADSDEARLRSALIPLLLRHPEYANHAETAASEMAEPTRLAFMCYYSAACFLQRKYRSRLAVLVDDADPLPNLFSDKLGLSGASDPNTALQLLADRHRILSGRPINWLGTYEHAAVRWLTHMERRQAWAA